MKMKLGYTGVRTWNMGNYESARSEIHVEVVLPAADDEQLEVEYDRMKSWVDNKLKQEELKLKAG